jgi:hypothetical protein
MNKNLGQKTKNKLLGLSKIYLSGILLILSMFGCDRCQQVPDTELIGQLVFSIPKKNIVGEEKVALVIKNSDSSKVADLSLYELQLEIIEQKGKDNSKASGAYLVYEDLKGRSMGVDVKQTLLLSQLKDGNKNLEPDASRTIHISVAKGTQEAREVKFTIALCKKDNQEVAATKHTIIWTGDKKSPKPAPSVVPKPGTGTGTSAPSTQTGQGLFNSADWWTANKSGNTVATANTPGKPASATGKSASATEIPASAPSSQGSQEKPASTGVAPASETETPASAPGSPVKPASQTETPASAPSSPVKPASQTETPASQTEIPASAPSSPAKPASTGEESLIEEKKSVPTDSAKPKPDLFAGLEAENDSSGKK